VKTVTKGISLNEDLANFARQEAEEGVYGNVSCIYSRACRLNGPSPGLITRLHGIATPFGNLALDLTIATDGKTARLRVESLSDGACRKIIVHLAGWASGKKDGLTELGPKSPNDRTIPLAPDSSKAN
jgi:hypothetical protein